jgi:hypothetical protein
MMRVFVAAVCVLFFTVIGTAHALPAEMRRDVLRPKVARVDRVLATVPADVKRALQRLFAEPKLSMADAGAEFRETDTVAGRQDDLPVRQFVLGFETADLYYVYYRAGGFESAGKLVVFKRTGRNYRFIWGGVEFGSAPGNPVDVIRRLRAKRFDDSKAFLW